MCEYWALRTEILRILQLNLLENFNTVQKVLNGAESVVFEFCCFKMNHLQNL